MVVRVELNNVMSKLSMDINFLINRYIVLVFIFI
jgi:hypothetical protein